MRDKFEKTTIVLEVETCKECPMCTNHRTLQAGFAIDYHCNHPLMTGCGDDPNRPGKLIMGYVEYSVDEKPVPDWCPLVKDYVETVADDILLGHVEEMRKEIDAHDVYIANLRNKYGRLHTYWQLQNLDQEYKLASYNFEELKQANHEFVKLLKFTGSAICDRHCTDCLLQCDDRSFLIKREKKEDG
jgi:hypothetical protein